MTAYDLYFGMFQFNLYGVFSVITVLMVILFGLDVGPMYKAEKRARETGMTYAEEDNLIAQPPEGEVPEEYNLTMKNFPRSDDNSDRDHFRLCFLYGKDLGKRTFRRVHSRKHPDVHSHVLPGRLHSRSDHRHQDQAHIRGRCHDRWTKGAGSMMQVIMILVCAWA